MLMIILLLRNIDRYFLTFKILFKANKSIVSMDKYPLSQPGSESDVTCKFKKEEGKHNRYKENSRKYVKYNRWKNPPRSKMKNPQNMEIIPGFLMKLNIGNDPILHCSILNLERISYIFFF